MLVKLSGLKFSRIGKLRLIQSIKIGLIASVISLIIIVIFGKHQIVVETSLIGFMIGFLLGIFEYFVAQAKFKKFRFPTIFFVNSIFYLFIVLISVIILALVKISIAQKCTLFEAASNNNILSYLFTTDLGLYLLGLIIFSFIINLTFRVSQILGPGVLWNLIIGKYHTPRLEERIFLFLDMDDSTSNAEKLGIKKYSSLLQDFFSDLSEPLLKTQGKIFQYVGDEVVIVWDSKKGFRNNNALMFYFYFMECIENNREKYIRDYGFVPTFKAGIHFGETMITEVGEIKKDIVYHGDLINTTSRIRSACKQFKKNVLISENFLNKLLSKNDFLIESLGPQKLKGKMEEINLFSINLSERVNSIC